MKFRTAVLSSLLAGCLTGSVAHAADLLVPKQFATIQSAIDAAANGDSVLVSPGTYHEQVNLSGKGIALIGVGGAAVTAIDGDNTRTVIVGSGEPDTCLVQGFTIRNGYTNGSGGGVFVQNSSVRVTDCVFTGNRAGFSTIYGAAAWLSRHGSPAISRCVFRDNISQRSTSGVYHYLSGSISVSDCLFVDNGSHHANPVRVQNEGGAINLSLLRCTFRRNTNTAAVGSFEATWFHPILLWSPFGGTITGSISDCTFDNPQVPIGMSTSFLAPVFFGFSGYQVTLSGNTACEFPVWSVQAGGAAWTDGGGNTLSPTCCPSDLDGNGIVNAVDLSYLLAQWGDCIGCRADTTADDGIVEGKDLATLLSAWGVCQ